MREHAARGPRTHTWREPIRAGGFTVRAGSLSYSIHARRHSPAECQKTRTEEFADNRSTGAKTKPSLLVLFRPRGDSVCERKVVWGKLLKKNPNPKRIRVPTSVDQTCELGVQGGCGVCVCVCVSASPNRQTEALWKCRNHHEKGSQRDTQGQLLCTAPNQPTDRRRSYLPC